MHKLCDFAVTPCVGVWIEIGFTIEFSVPFCVTPCVGVWIEIAFGIVTTLPPPGHSLRGSVD